VLPNPLFTPNDSHIVSRLPAELLTHIVGYLMPSRSWLFHRNRVAHPDPHDSLVKIEENLLTHQHTIVHLMAVDWSWHHALKPMLYGRPVIISTTALRKIAYHIKMLPSLGELIREIVLLDRTGGEETPTSFYTTVYCGKLEAKVATQEALRTILTLKHSGIISVVFITGRSPMVTSGACGGSLLGRLPRLSSQHPKTVDDSVIAADRESLLLLDGLRSLTLHGYASHLLYAPSSRAFDNSRVGFTHLESLVLDSLQMAKADWPAMPALVSLVIKNCSQVGHCLPSREQAPVLTYLVIIPEWPSSSDHTSAFVHSLEEHAPYLRSLWIEYAVFQEIFSSSHLFTRLRELVIQLGRCVGDQIDPLSLGFKLPRSLSILRAVHMRANYQETVMSYMWVLFNQDYVQNALATVWEHRDIGNKVQITGSELFWQCVDPEVIAAAKLTSQEKGITWITRYSKFFKLTAIMECSLFPTR
jgi:hypothetical protein